MGASSEIVTMAAGPGSLVIMLASEATGAYPAEPYPGDYLVIIGITLTYLIAGIVLVGSLMPTLVRSPQAQSDDGASAQGEGATIRRSHQHPGEASSNDRAPSAESRGAATSGPAMSRAKR